MLEDEFRRYFAGTWMRSPRSSRCERASRKCALIWVKVSHLPTSAERRSSAGGSLLA